METKQHYPGLDGLRAIAVLMVIVYHAGNHRLSGYSAWPMLGAMGVRLFFVLSGFLITGILWRARAEAIDGMAPIYRAFLVRRALRIFPAAYLVLGFAWLVGEPELHGHGIWYWAYLSNFRIAALQQWPHTIGHFWSLAVEEQFYLLWPLLVLWLPRRGVPIALAVLCGIALWSRWFLSGDLFAASILPFSRWDALALGSVAAIYQPRAWWVAAVGIAVMLVRLGVDQEAALVFLCAAAVLWSAQHGIASRLLAWQPLVKIGKLSYGMYLWHPIVLLAYRPESVIISAIWTIGTSIGIAWVSWTLIEGPLNDLKRHLPYAPRTVFEPGTTFTLYGMS